MDELLRELNLLGELNLSRTNYAKTLALLRALKAGTVTLNNVTMTDDGWQVALVIEEPKLAETEDSQPADA